MLILKGPGLLRMLEETFSKSLSESLQHSLSGSISLDLIFLLFPPLISITQDLCLFPGNLSRLLRNA